MCLLHAGPVLLPAAPREGGTRNMWLKILKLILHGGDTSLLTEGGQCDMSWIWPPNLQGLGRSSGVKEKALNFQ